MFGINLPWIHIMGSSGVARPSVVRVWASIEKFTQFYCRKVAVVRTWVVYRGCLRGVCPLRCWRFFIFGRDFLSFGAYFYVKIGQNPMRIYVIKFTKYECMLRLNISFPPFSFPFFLFRPSLFSPFFSPFPLFPLFSSFFFPLFFLFSISPYFFFASENFPQNFPWVGVPPTQPTPWLRHWWDLSLILPNFELPRK